VNTVFFTHFHLVVKGNPVGDLELLEQYFENESLEVHMQVLKYDEKAARQHVKKVVDILKTPSILVAQTE